MSPQFPARRDAEEFARVLDGGASTDVADRYRDLAHTVTLLREQPRPEPRADFVADLRTRLMAEADVVLRPTAPTSLEAHRTRRVGRRERTLGAAAAAFVLVGTTAGMAAAAQGSLPGQTLYPLKRGIESVEVHLSTSDSTRGQQLLDQAATRLTEVRALVDGPSTPESDVLVRSTLDDFTATADEGSRLLFASFQGSGDAGDITVVRNFTHGTMDVLRSLAGSTTDSGSGFASAGETLADIDQQARVLCRGCSDAPPLAVPSSLVDLTSAAALQQLVTGPAQAAAQASRFADKARTEASRAEQAAQAAAGALSSAAGSGGVTQDGQTQTDDGIASPPAKRSAGSSTSSSTDQPLRHLIAGVTTALPGDLGGTVQGVTGSLGQTVTGLTDGLQQTTDGLDDTLSGITGLLGGTTPTAGPTPTQ